LRGHVRTVVEFISGVVVGTLVASLAFTHWQRSKTEYVLTKELAVTPGEALPDLGMRGVLQPGTRFRVDFRKGVLNYVEFEAALLDKDLRGKTRPFSTSAGRAPWDNPVNIAN